MRNDEKAGILGFAQMGADPIASGAPDLPGCDTLAADAKLPEGHFETVAESPEAHPEGYHKTANAFAHQHPHVHGADQAMHKVVAQPGDGIVQTIGAASHTGIGSETSWADFFNLLATETPSFEAVVVILADGALIELVSFFAALEVAINSVFERHTEKTVEKWERCYHKILRNPETQGMANDPPDKDRSLRTVSIASYLAGSKTETNETLHTHRLRTVGQWKRSYDVQRHAGLGKKESFRNVMLKWVNLKRRSMRKQAAAWAPLSKISSQCRDRCRIVAWFCFERWSWSGIRDRGTQATLRRFEDFEGEAHSVM